MGTKAKATPARMAGWAGAAGALGTPAVIAATHPVLAAALFGAELALVGIVVVMVSVTFMYGSDEHRERIFRLLRLLKGHPEPAPPPRPRTLTGARSASAAAELTTEHASST